MVVKKTKTKQKTRHPSRDCTTRGGGGNTDGDGGDVSVARGWRNARTDGGTETERASERAGPSRGGNPLSAKLCSAGMYSRLFTHVTRLAAAQRAVCLGTEDVVEGGDEGNKMDVERRR